MRALIASAATGIIAAVIAVVVALAVTGDSDSAPPAQSTAAVQQVQVPTVAVDAALDQAEDPPPDAQAGAQADTQAGAQSAQAEPARQPVAATPAETNDVEEPEGGLPQLAPLDGFNPAQIFVDVSPSVVAIEAGLSGGSGFFIDTAGHVVTNYHVVQGAAELFVVDTDGNRSPAQMLGFDAANDLAVLQVDVALVTVRPVSLADSDAVIVGEPVAAIGNPFGLQTSLTTGVVSAIERTRPGLEVGGRPQRGLIQTDAAINPGNSGGVLLNAQGEVIGVTASVESPVRGSVGVGFAIPSNTVARSLSDMIAGETVVHPWIGITAGGTAGDPPTVGSVVAGGPADQGGLRAGDTLLSVDGVPLDSFETLASFLFDKSVGDTVSFDVDRGGSVVTVEVTLGAWPS